MVSYLIIGTGLAGKNEMEQVRVDMIMECMEDTIKSLSAVFRETDEEKKVRSKLAYTILLYKP